jgi:hypothetical protein
MITLTSWGPIDLRNPKPDEMNLRAIAGQIAKINRWAGATQLPVSVAKHTVLVASLCDIEVRPFALLHDMHEALLGEIPQPVKVTLQEMGASDHLDRLQAALDEAITLAAGLPWPWPAAATAAVKAADLRALATEWRDFTNHPLPDWASHYPPSPRALRGSSWAMDEQALVTELHTHLPAMHRYLGGLAS